MRKARAAIAVVLVASALCADRAVAAAPELKPQVADLAGRLVNRLTSTFRRTVPTPRMYQARTDARPRPAVAPVAIVTIAPRTQQIQPFQFRLPPPLA